MYWSCAQSTGAEMRKYFTAASISNRVACNEDKWRMIVTYNCRPAAMLRRSRRAGSAEHLDPARKSQEQPDAAAVAAWRGAEERST